MVPPPAELLHSAPGHFPSNPELVGKPQLKKSHLQRGVNCLPSVTPARNSTWAWRLYFCSYLLCPSVSVPASGGSQGRNTLSKGLIWGQGQDRGAWDKRGLFQDCPAAPGVGGPRWGAVGPGALRGSHTTGQRSSHRAGWDGEAGGAPPHVRGACPASGGHPAQDTADQP